MAARFERALVTGTRTPHLTRPDRLGESLAASMADSLIGAICTTVQPDTFFPEPSDKDGVELAKSICRLCPVQQACLAAALERGERFGIFGGLTPDERDALYRGPGACGTPSGYNRHYRHNEKPCEPCRAAHREKQQQAYQANRTAAEVAA